MHRKLQPLLDYFSGDPSFQPSRLVAGARVSRAHCEEFDDGTPDGTHRRLIRELLTEVFRASGIALEMLDRCPDTPASIASASYLGMGLLLVCVRETDDAGYGSEFFFHRG